MTARRNADKLLGSSGIDESRVVRDDEDGERAARTREALGEGGGEDG